MESYTNDNSTGMDSARSWAQRRGGCAVVLGGGPSLELDVETVYEAGESPTLISVKQHGLMYLRSFHGIDADACVFLESPDDPAQEALRAELLMAPECWLVSPFPWWSHVELDEPWWNGGFSASLAVWFACACGFDPVLLAGFDLYQGPCKYWYDRPGYSHPAMHAPLEHHLNAWRPALEHCPNVERVRAVSGPLAEIFGRWVP